MNQLRFTLNNTILNDDPDNWKDIEIKIFRDSVIKGLFIKYTSELAFIGDGYTIIKNEYDTNGACGSVTARIEKLNGTSYVTVFTGIIYMSNVIFNPENGKATAPIEEDSLSALILKNKSLKVSLDYAIEKTLGGTQLTDIANDCSFHDPLTGMAYATRKVYRIRDVLQYILDIITDSGITLDSDFFITDTDQGHIQTVDFDADFVAGNVITVTMHKFDDDPDVRGTNFNTDQATTIADIINNNTGIGPGSEESQTQSILVPRWQRITSGGSRSITYQSHVPYTIDSVVVTGGATQPNATITINVPFTDGMKDLCITNGYQLIDAGIAPVVSLDEVIQELNKMFGVTFKVFDNAGTPTFKIEKTEDFFTGAPLFNLQNKVRVKQFTPDSEFNNVVAQVGFGDDDYFTGSSSLGAFNKGKFYVSLCDQEPLNLENEWLANTVTIEDTLKGTTTDHDSDDIFFVIVTNADAAAPFTAGQFSSGKGSTSYWPYNLYLTNWNKIRYNYFRINGDPHSNSTADNSAVADHFIANNRVFSLKNKYTVEAILSFSEMQLIIGSPENTIQFMDGSNLLKGWINEITYLLISGKTEIECLTE